MKTMYLILTMFLFITGCNEEKTEQQENPIYGSWKLAKRTANNANGSPNDWQNVNNGFILKFEESLRFESNESTICQNNLNEGVFLISTIENEAKDIIEVSINNCDGSPNGSFIRLFYYSFNENDLILIPKDPACDEGCAFLYIKNNE